MTDLRGRSGTVSSREVNHVRKTMDTEQIYALAGYEVDIWTPYSLTL